MAFMFPVELYGVVKISGKWLKGGHSKVFTIKSINSKKATKKLALFSEVLDDT